MALDALPWTIQGSTTPAQLARNHTAAIFAAPVAALAPAVQVTTAGGGHGVIGATDFAVTAGGGMNVTIGPGRAVIRGSSSGGAGSLGSGCYTVTNDAAVTIAVAAANPTNPRRDLVVVRIPDTNYGDANNIPVLQVITGTPAASPADPVVLSNCVVLARVTVPALGATVLAGWLTDLRSFAYAAGGIARCTSATRPSGPSLYAGLEIWENDTGNYMYWTGAAWANLADHPSLNTRYVSSAAVAWTAYTPVWSGTIGNGTIQGFYQRIGRTINWRAHIGWGSTTSHPSGQQNVQLPFAVAANYNAFASMGVSSTSDSSAGARYLGTSYVAIEDNLNLWFNGGQQIGATTMTAVVTAIAPFTWAVNDELSASGTYEAAT